MENSKIEWTDHTWNPWIGCSKVSPGCENCYACDQQAHRYGRVEWGPGKPRHRTAESNWKLPYRWNRKAAKERIRLKVFSASLADWLDNEVPVEWRVDFLEVIRATPDLDWLLLTKRIQSWAERVEEAIQYIQTLPDRNSQRPCMEPLWNWLREWLILEKPPANIWIGTSAEDQKRWKERLPQLMLIPAKIRFVSAEPLLDPITLSRLRPDWLIVGGESGDNARPMEMNWVRNLRDQCLDQGVPFHFKQWGTRDKKTAGRLLDGRTWDEFPIVS